MIFSLSASAGRPPAAELPERRPERDDAIHRALARTPPPRLWRQHRFGRPSPRADGTLLRPPPHPLAARVPARVRLRTRRPRCVPHAPAPRPLLLLPHLGRGAPSDLEDHEGSAAPRRRVLSGRDRVGDRGGRVRLPAPYVHGLLVLQARDRPRPQSPAPALHGAVLPQRARRNEPLRGADAASAEAGAARGNHSVGQLIRRLLIACFHRNVDAFIDNNSRTSALRAHPDIPLPDSAGGRIAVGGGGGRRSRD